MGFFQNHYRIEPSRLSNWDYSTPGYYFVTICTQDHACLFGEISNGKIRLNDLGHSASDCINQIPTHFLTAKIDEHIIMPNHVHAIIQLCDVNAAKIRHKRDVACYVSTKIKGPTADSKMAAISPKPQSLSTIVRSFKSETTKQIRSIDCQIRHVWQPRFHDHIIRNDRELFAIRLYIRNNPTNWENDRNVIETSGIKTGKQPWFVYMG